VKYRHAFHAGNFADVHKHVVLLALFEALQRKDKGFLYVDTHAGDGLYDLRSADARQGAHESANGIERLRSDAGSAAPAPAPAPALIERYLALVAEARRASGIRHAYPGSPWLAAQALRPQDRAVCCEARTEAFVALRRALRDATRVNCENVDGYERLPALLPPVERRGLVLIDPPYEDGRDDRRRIGTTLEESLRRFATGVYVVWYPIKHDADTGRWLDALRGRLAQPWLTCELWLHPRDTRIGLNGSGMLVIHPPYLVDAQLRETLPWLLQALGVTTAQGGWSVDSG
jgi:23S rRNA (adenine2030-N6)-methyltransferase